MVLASPVRAEVIAREKRITPITAHGSYAAWSRFDGRAFRLMIWHDGRARRAAVRSRPAPFDADLGVDARGRVVAVYSRCAGIEPPGRRDTVLPSGVENEGCDLYQYDVRTRRERRLARPSRTGTSEFLPAIAGDRLVFARRGAALNLPRLISAKLDRYREQPLPRPSGFADVEVEGGNVGPLTFDVAGDRAILGWQHTARPGACGETDDFRLPTDVVALYDLNTRQRGVLDDDCLMRRGGAGFISPSVDERFAYYGFFPAGPPDTDWAVRRVDLASGALLDTVIGNDWLRATQTSGGWSWTVTDAPGVDFTIARVAAPRS